LLGDLTLADVTNDADEEAFVQALDFADGEGQWEDGGITTQPFDFAADADDLGRPPTGVVVEVFAVIRAIWIGHEHAGVVALKLGLGVAEYPDNSGVAGLDYAVVIDGDRCHRGRCRG